MDIVREYHKDNCLFYEWVGKIAGRSCRVKICQDIDHLNNPDKSFMVGQVLNEDQWNTLVDLPLYRRRDFIRNDPFGLRSGGECPGFTSWAIQQTEKIKAELLTILA